MAKVELLAPYILKWEGGFVNDPDDRGGATNMGVTIATRRQVGYDKDGDGDIDVADLKLLTREDVIRRVLKPHYRDRRQADKITSRAVADIPADLLRGSGVYGIRIPQRVPGVAADGIVGPRTPAAVNAAEPCTFFDEIKAEREAFLQRIVENRPAQRKFLRGRQNRLNDLKFE